VHSADARGLNRRGGRKVFEESPDIMEQRYRLTTGGGDPRDRTTESKPPCTFGCEVRVKGCGKSAPRTW